MSKFKFDSQEKFMKALVAVIALGLGTGIAFGMNAISSEETSSEMGQVIMDEQPVTLGYLLDEIYNISAQEGIVENIEGATKEDKIRLLKQSGILNNFGVYGAYDDGIHVSRDMLLSFTTDIVRATSKNNVPQEFVPTITDIFDYQELEIEYVLFNELYSSGTDFFHGITIPKEQEALNDLKKFKSILAKTDPVEFEIAEVSWLEENTSSMVEASGRAIEQKDIADTLYGLSTAVYESPKNTSELLKNIQSMKLADPYTNDNRFDFIMPDQGLANWDKINDFFVNGEKISGLTICDLPIGITVNVNTEYDEPEVLLGHPDLQDMGSSLYGIGYSTYENTAYLVNDFNVYASGNYLMSSDGEKVDLAFDLKDFEKAEYICLISEKEVLTGDYTGETEYVGVLFEIDKYIKDLL